MRHVIIISILNHAQSKRMFGHVHPRGFEGAVTSRMDSPTFWTPQSNYDRPSPIPAAKTDSPRFFGGTPFPSDRFRRILCTLSLSERVRVTLQLSG